MPCPAIELVGVLERRFGEEDAELVPADMTSDVRRAQDLGTRSAASASTASPARCPILSLTSLKSSRFPAPTHGKQARERERKGRRPTMVPIRTFVIANSPTTSTRSAQSKSPEQAKELLRLLVKEIRVHNRRRILPTYRVPAAVRAIPPKVEPAGLEPATSCMPCKRSPS
jgi:electron transfer flavoprotein alpha subunit